MVRASCGCALYPDMWKTPQLGLNTLVTCPEDNDNGSEYIDSFAEGSEPVSRGSGRVGEAKGNLCAK